MRAQKAVFLCTSSKSPISIPQKIFTILALLIFLDTDICLARVKEDWIATYKRINDSPSAMTADSAGNSYVIGYSWVPYDSYATVKYDTDGNEQWVAIEMAPESRPIMFQPEGIAVDSEKNVYVTGGTENETGLQTTYFLIKYNAAGSKIWMAEYNGYPSGRRLNPYVDGKGNVYITVPSDNGLTTIKHDKNGKTVWMSSGAGGGGRPVALLVDGAENVYVTLESGSTIKYGSDGNLSWIVNFCCPMSGHALDSSGNIYVSGGVIDFVTVKCNKDGDELWTASYHDSGNRDAHARGVTLDGEGNVYVTGAVGIANNWSITTVKYDTNGNQLWTAAYYSPLEGSQPSGIALDDQGNVYVTGVHTPFDGSTESIESPTIKYAPDGKQLWVYLSNATPVGIALDSESNVYVAGGMANGGHITSGYVTFKLSQGSVDPIGSDGGSGGGGGCFISTIQK